MDEERCAMMSTISLRLIDVLNHVGLSEVVRWKRRQLAVEYEIIETLRLQQWNGSVYIFGSQAEGSTIPGMGSDIDFLECLNNFTIIQSMDEWIPERLSCVMLQEEWTKPGYVKLWCCDPFTPQLLKDEHGNTFVFDDVGRGLSPRFPREHADSSNGPAATFDLTGSECSSFDHVGARKCNSWPHQALKWFQRRRPYNWPSQSMISEIKNNGCFLVAVGHPFSEERDLEWKISFSLSERQLIWSLNEVQFKCYVLLKVIVKTFFKPYMEDSLCSYHCKMCILHVAENTEERLWTPENLLLGLSQCLQYFLKWLKQGNLPHYFLPEHNLFEHKVHGRVRTQAYSILQQLISEDFGFLHRIECDNIGQLLRASCNSSLTQTIRLTLSKAVYKNIGFITSSTAASAITFHLNQVYSTYMMPGQADICTVKSLNSSIVCLLCLSMSNNVVCFLPSLPTSDFTTLSRVSCVQEL